MTTRLDADSAVELVRAHGVLLASANGDVPRLIDAIIGERIHGNWWRHPQGKLIYNVLADVCSSENVLVCRLVQGRITLVHRRVWPALVRVADRFPPERLARLHEEHMPSGRHTTRATPFPLWVPTEVREAAAALSESDAMAVLGKVAVSGRTSPTRAQAGAAG